LYSLVHINTLENTKSGVDIDIHHLDMVGVARSIRAAPTNKIKEIQE
jgi:hypothetical protein